MLFADSRTRANQFKFAHVRANCESFRHSFFPATISDSNSLSFGIVETETTDDFKLEVPFLSGLTTGGITLIPLCRVLLINNQNQTLLANSCVRHLAKNHAKAMIKKQI